VRGEEKGTYRKKGEGGGLIGLADQQSLIGKGKSTKKEMV